MKIVENSAARFVLQEAAANEQLGGGGLAAVGLVVLVGGGLSVKSWPVYVSGGLFLLIGGFLLLSAKSSTVTADKVNRQLSIKTTSLRNRDGQVQVFGFDDIDSVQTTEEYRAGQGNNAQAQSTIRLTLGIVLRTGAAVVLGEERRSASELEATTSALADQGQTLAKIMGVPFGQLDDDNESSMPAASRSFDDMPQVAQAVTEAPTYQPVPPPTISTPVEPPTQLASSTPTPAAPVLTPAPIVTPPSPITSPNSPEITVSLQSPQPSQIIRPQSQPAEIPTQPPTTPPAP